MITFAGYAFGLMLTYIFLILFYVAQPALLYLVPCMLIPLLFFATHRGDLLLLWSGLPHEKIEHIDEETVEDKV